MVPPSPAQRQVRIATALLAALYFPAAERGYRACSSLIPRSGKPGSGWPGCTTQRGDSAQAFAACQQGRRHGLTPAQTSFLQGLETLIEPLEPDR